ncbi:MAG TPA: GNAT family N-acetyltransferase [Candidatus Limnocylindrales bacterium]|nr:GNAT family N-acetyltransferase [Candidatus Limnocylindrales bacterium]
MTIRPARPADFAAMQEIEVEAGSMFAAIGMDSIAEDEPFTLDELAAYTAADHAWVAVDDDDRPVGYLVAELVDGRAHIEQVSVRPSRARRGIGRRLVDHVATWAAAEGLPALTLTTFADVPWNAQLYERLGFRRLDEDELSSGLRHLRDEEAARSLDRWPRVAMIRVVAPPAG